MKTTYDSGLKAQITFDDKKRVRHILHNEEYWESEESIPRVSADQYLHAVADKFQIPTTQLTNLHKQVSFLEPREQGVEFQFAEEKHLFDAITVGYAQTYLNVPVWRKGVSVTIKQGPNRVVESTGNTEDDLRGKLPDVKSIQPLQALFRRVELRKLAAKAGLGDVGEADDDGAFVLNMFNLKPAAPPTKAGAAVVQPGDPHDGTRLMSGKFVVYKYDPRKRYGGKPDPDAKLVEKTDVKAAKLIEEDHAIALPALPPLNKKIEAGTAYLCAELIFSSDAPGFHGFVWLVLLEIETGSILYIECMTCGVNGLVFRRDPVVKTGNTGITSAAADLVLDPLRDDVVLSSLDAPTAGTQRLRGTYVDVQALTTAHADPDPAPPTQPSGVDFDYHARTNDFGAVNAYYHMTQLIQTIESLGFPRATYFDGTTFPIPVDHRSLGDVINAHWFPNGADGTNHMCFALCDTTNTAAPLARAVDPWVHWHEMGGHGTLGDHVGSGNFGFAHSAGDGLAALQMDPDSGLRALPERFRYAPFRPFTDERRFDRPVATWAWGSGNDDGQYGSEQILATCHFRIYRSIGGDHNDLGRRQFASRAMTYLILRAIGNLTSGTNPADPETWAGRLMAADLLNWTSEGISGGAYNKVIRWSFEKQGAFQPVGALPPITTPGAPPVIDVYIDDGRAGEYQFQPVHWGNTSMWNSNTIGGTTHNNAIEAADNYLYGKIKNRGTSVANSVTVRAFHSKPGAGLTWPDDFVEMSPVGGVSVSGIPANSTADVTVGPFTWQPNINAYGHDCTLLIASHAQDPSNIDNFTGSETVAEWRLVPNDNNIGQRNITVVPGAESEVFVRAIDGAPFWAGNPFNRAAQMHMEVNLPKVLAAKGWRIVLQDADGGKFRLRPGEKRKVTLKLKPGSAFSADDIRNVTDRDIRVDLYGNDMLIGGMTYRIDPDLTQVSGGARTDGKDCRGAAQTLLDCLNLPGDQKVKKVCVKKVSVDIELDNDCGCE